MITAPAPPCSSSGLSPILSGALETLNHTHPTPTSACWKTCFWLSGALRKNTTPHLAYRVVLSGLCPPVQPHSPPFSSSPSSKTGLLSVPQIFSPYFQPQGLCTGCSLVCNALPSHLPKAGLFWSFRSLFKCHLLWETFPEHLHALSSLAHGSVLFILNITPLWNFPVTGLSSLSRCGMSECIHCELSGERYPSPVNALRT